MRFKVGDKVRVREKKGLRQVTRTMDKRRERYAGEVLTITEILGSNYITDETEVWWKDEMLEPIEDPLVTKILERNNRPVKMISDEILLNAKITNIKLDEITGDIKTFGGDLTTDKVNSPSHYQIGEIETIDIIQTMLTPEEYVGFIKGNIIKYRERAPYKGQSEEDYKKAKKYYDILEEIENEK